MKRRNEMRYRAPLTGQKKDPGSRFQHDVQRTIQKRIEQAAQQEREGNPYLSPRALQRTRDRALQNMEAWEKEVLGMRDALEQGWGTDEDAPLQHIGVSMSQAEAVFRQVKEDSLSAAEAFSNVERALEEPANCSHGMSDKRWCRRCRDG